MKDTLVSLELALLLKKKGFDFHTDNTFYRTSNVYKGEKDVWIEEHWKDDKGLG